MQKKNNNNNMTLHYSMRNFDKICK